MNVHTEKPKKGFFGFVERAGNALPHPALLFGLFAVITLLFSAIGGLLGWTGVHPATGRGLRGLQHLQVLHPDGARCRREETAAGLCEGDPLQPVSHGDALFPDHQVRSPGARQHQWPHPAGQPAQ